MIKILSSLFIFLTLFSNYLYSKEVNYFCSEYKATGIEPDENYSVQDYDLVSFEATIDKANNKFNSEDIHMIDNICIEMFTQEHVMQCTNDYGHMFAFNKFNNDFAFATLIGVSLEDEGDSLLISYGKCERN